MICDECQKRPTKVHITRIVNGQKTNLSLCEECAKKYQKYFSPSPNPEQSFSIHKFLAGLLDEDFEEGVPLEFQTEDKCPKCGLTYGEFSVHGRLGCGQCYQTFKTRIDPLLEKIHGNNVHVGKLPGQVASAIYEEDIQADETQQELGKLRSELQALVAEERFEEAATVRDRIREIEAQIEGTS